MKNDKKYNSQEVILDEYSLWVYPINVEGNIIDKKGRIIVGAIVNEVGTENCVKTDLFGNFTLEDVEQNSTLNISYEGFKETEFSAMKLPEVITMEKKANSFSLISDDSPIKPFLKSNYFKYLGYGAAAAAIVFIIYKVSSTGSKSKGMGKPIKIVL
jgi:hypothetical protein